jgi:hypothetical protein
MAQLKSTSVTGNLSVTGNVLASKIIKLGGTKNEILCADGSTTTLSSLGAGTVTSVGLSVPTGLTVSGSPVTSSGTLAITFTTGYSIPTTEKQSNWDAAYGWGNHANAGYLTSHQDISTYVNTTKNASVSVAGTTKDTYTYNKTTIFAPNGLIMGGTAAAAGLVTRGICGVSTPNATTGACTKDYLYLNFDGNSTWNAAARAVIINAGELGTDLGSGMYQYAAVRGDIVKAWVEAKGYLTSHQDLSGCVSKVTSTDNALVRFNGTSGAVQNSRAILDDTGNLKINNSDGGDITLELARGTNANWRFLGSGGNLFIQSDYTSSKGSYYNVISLAYNSGAATFKGNITTPGLILATSGGTAKASLAYNSSDDCIELVWR